MTSPRTSGAYGWLSADDRGPQLAVEEMLKLLGKASRAHQLYLANNPTYLRAVELLRNAIGAVWSQQPELTLQVSERALLLDNKPVFQELERASDTLPWLLYKDGVRELMLLPGFEEEEVEAFLAVLGLLRRASVSEDDAITLLWERDFSFLRYRYVEPMGDDEQGGYELGETPGRLSGGAEKVLETRMPAPEGVVRMKDFDGTVHFLVENELSYLRGALAQEYAHDLHADAANQLLDVLELVPARQVRDEVCAALEQLMLVALSSGDYRVVAHILRETKVALSRAVALDQVHRDRLQFLSASMSEPEGLGQLLELLEAGTIVPSDAELDELFAELRPSALRTVFLWIERARAARLRAALRRTGDRLALADTGELVRLIGSDEATVAREAVRRAGELRSQGAIPALAAALRREDRTLRVEAAQALVEIATPGALDVLTSLIASDERDVRIVALRAVGARGYRAAFSRIEALVRDRQLRDRDLTEQMAVFESYGSMCGEAGVPLLDTLLSGRSLIGRKADSNLRACAAIALGRVGTERAAQALRKAADEKEAVVRTAVQRALRGVR